jgi:sugar fermentation stimulation protein A
MKFAEELRQGTFLKRYKRFFADIQLDQETVVAHVPNTGSLKSCIDSERLCLVSTNQDPKRKLKHTLQMVQTESSWVGVNTALPSTLVWELWQSGQHAPWRDFDCAQAEVKISAESRIDLVLWNSHQSFAVGEKLTLPHCLQNTSPLHFIEIKNVTLAEGKQALFPDCLSTRAQKHVRELMNLVARGHSAEFVFVVQREDCEIFRAAHEIDPTYAKLLEEAAAKGVHITPFPCRLDAHGIVLNSEPLPILQRDPV